MLLKLDLPLRVIIPRKTKADKIWNVNLNVYRNEHHRLLNEVKILYKNLVWEELVKSKQENIRIRNEKLIFNYTLFPPSHRKLDVANILSVVDKFTSDALVESKIIEEDNYTIVQSISYTYGKVNKDYPHAELCIGRVSPASSNEH